jgi:hypothetical protein
VREKYYWLVVDKPSEHGIDILSCENDIYSFRSMKSAILISLEQISSRLKRLYYSHYWPHPVGFDMQI